MNALRDRKLSACEEETEVDETDASVNRSQSPLYSPRSRKLLSARSSPNVAKSVSRSDISEDDEEDDAIMELSYYPRQVTTRQSPLASPHLSSRLSPVHTLGYSSDEEYPTTIHDGRRKRPSKRLRYKKTLHPLVRVDSASSDDSCIIDRPLRHSLPKFGKEKLRKIIPYHSVPSTPAEASGSESFVDLLAVRRPRSNSARTDSSLSDTAELAVQMSGRFELSDGEELEESCDRIMEGVQEEGMVHQHTRTNSSLSDPLTRSAVCCLL